VSIHPGEQRGRIFTPYQSQLNLMSFGQVDDPRMPPGKQASDVYGYLYPHITAGCLEHGNLNVARPDMEYRLWCYDRTRHRIGWWPPVGIGAQRNARGL